MSSNKEQGHAVQVGLALYFWKTVNWGIFTSEKFRENHSVWHIEKVMSYGVAF